ncbi:HD domain-containing protein [Halalkalicoccus jeotgali]|uniref:Metal dependent phosphohydrolase n=1 Tax=Halalkalicoccus jeotgali (strain DSM 18796 / CECT 7217 / JCM 14584 / KCTC 4019 / B3) TaxID=795797 RepID=D8J689_HALJB|nr:HD domain-containing protein [Halalkalicoccus jeotgali]ADJ15807.1 metal dependent phosphohydrolase [Halalkalicoccus jeotgali B3]ELY37169.1 metal dependent phosphohydrolase [Halalkalicoccus jeotgali B3]
MGVEIKETPVSEADFESMKRFVYEYLDASVKNEDEGGRMRWYPWHSAEYRFNHTLNVLSIAETIAREEGADVDVVRVAALFHDVAKLDADQEIHAEEGARVAREYLSSRGSFPSSFIDRVCRAITAHTHSGDLADLSLESQCLLEADLLDKVGANGTVLMILRMGYEARTHMDAATMVERVYERGADACERIESDTGGSIAHERLKRVRWFREWLEMEVPEMECDPDSLE